MLRQLIMATAIFSLALILAPCAANARDGNEAGRPPEPAAAAENQPRGVAKRSGEPPEPTAPETTTPDTKSESPPDTAPAPDPAPTDLPSTQEAPPPTIALREFLVLPQVGQYGRVPFHRDAIESMLVLGTFEPPIAGQEVALSGETARSWRAAKTGDDGQLQSDAIRGGYAFATVDSPEERVMILNAAGHSVVYVNGEPRVGDPYNQGYVRLPIRLRQGPNHFLFHVAAGRLRAVLEPIGTPYSIELADATLPDLIANESGEKWGAAVVVNASMSPLKAASLVCERIGGKTVTTAIATIPPLSIFKAPFQLESAASAGESPIAFKLTLRSGDGEPRELGAAEFQLPVVAPTDLHKRTFVSPIDGAVQYYAVRPAVPPPTNDAENVRKPGVLLALHGAGVEAKQFASVYAAKDWAHVVAPTNRRPYGFDWEDWGRRDALEVLDLAEERYGVDSQRVFVTGHSMGGHGSLHLGVLYPDRFAAIGPSAGWISFWSYGGMPKFENPTSMEKMMVRGALPSDTALLAPNLESQGVYVLHGQLDETVPVEQSRFLRSLLGKFHTNFVYHEQPGAKHWWGDPCCDWPPMMRFFQYHRRPEPKEVDRVRFLTVSPGVSSSMHWLSILAQETPRMPSSAAIEYDSKNRTFRGKTSNVSRLAIDVRHLASGAIGVALDGGRTVARWPGDVGEIWLERRDGKWRTIQKPSLDEKGPHRYGGFNDVFSNRPLLVYGTAGNSEENAWSFAKARFDAESFWYRGNGALEVIDDRSFNPDATKDRNVVLYGAAATNAAWPMLLSTSDVQVRQGEIVIGPRREVGDDLACLMIAPRKGSDTASVAVVSGTGIHGMRATNRLRYFVSGVGYPDLTIFDASVLTDGTPAVRALGYFGTDWKLERGDFVWRDLAL